MEHQSHKSCWCVARRTLVVFAVVAVAVYLTGGLDAPLVAAR
jgi:preprotein translocase subunit SecE